MKLKKEFITHETGTETLLVPTGSAAFAGLVKGNKTLGAILSLLREETHRGGGRFRHEGPLRRTGGDHRPGRQQGPDGASQNRRHRRITKQAYLQGETV